MPRAPDPLERGGDRPWRAQQAGEVHGAHVDAQLERSGGHHHGQLPRLEPLLGVEAPLTAQAAVVGGHPFRAQAIGQVAGHALDQAPGVDEHERGAVLPRERGHPVVDLLPLLVGADRAELVAQHLDGQVHVAPLAHVHHLGHRPRRPHEQPRRRLDRPDGGGEPDALQARPAPRDHQLLEPLEGERQVRPALVPGHRVDLVHDHGAHLREPAAARLGGEQDEQRLGRGDQHVGRAPAHLSPLVGRGVAGAHRGPDAGGGQARGRRGGRQLAERLFEVAAHVVGQGLERRDVEDRGAVFQAPLDPLAEEPVETGQERGEGLAGAGGRGHQHVLAGRDQRPGVGLHGRRLAEAGAEPGVDDGVEHRPSIVGLTSPRRLRSLVAPWRSGTRR